MTHQKDGQKISAVVACYLDVQAIPLMHQRLTKVLKDLGVEYEIIFVNDCSPDHSREVLWQIAQSDPRVIVINHTRNFGSQSAFTSGLTIATGDAAVLLDGDLQDPPELIREFYQKWRQGYEVVYGIRQRRKASLFARLCYKLFYRAFRALSYLPIPLDAGDFSLLDRKVIDALNRMPESNRFIRGLRAWVGFRQTGIPYTRPQRMFGHSTNSFYKNLNWAAKAIFSFSYAPLNFIIWLSFSTIFLTLLIMAAQITMRLLFPALNPRGFTSLVMLILFIGGIQFLCLGIMGVYLAHIYDEVKRRPPYLVESYFNYAPKGEE